MVAVVVVFVEVMAVGRLAAMRWMALPGESGMSGEEDSS